MRSPVAPERWLALLVLACGSCSTGCGGGLVGLGIGALVPRWEYDASTERLDRYREKGPVDVDVQLRTGRVSGSYSRTITKWASPTSTAIYISNPGTVVVPGQWPALVVMTDKGERRIQLPDAQRVDVRKGSHWATGLGVGIAIDVAIVVLGAILIAKNGFYFGG